MELEKLVGKPARDIKLALIENAADTYDSNHRAWVDSNRVSIQSHDFNVEIIDLRQFGGKEAQLKQKLKRQDIVWFGGGNTYYLRWLLQHTGVDKILAELISNGIVYGGGSAGAIVAGPTLKHFETADDPNDAPIVLFDGLRFTDSVVVPHMDNAKLAAIVQSINDKLRAGGYKTVPLTDAQAFVVNGAEEKVI